MYFEITTDNNLIKYIHTFPGIFESIKEDGQTKEEFEIPNGTYFALFNDDKTLIGLYRVIGWAKRVLEIHVRILPKYWGKDISKESLIEFIKLVNKSDYADIIMTYAPDNSVAEKAARRLGFKEIGRLAKALCLDSKRVDSVWLSLDLRENKNNG